MDTHPAASIPRPTTLPLVSGSGHRSRISRSGAAVLGLSVTAATRIELGRRRCPLFVVVGTTLTEPPLRLCERHGKFDSDVTKSGRVEREAALGKEGKKDDFCPLIEYDVKMFYRRKCSFPKGWTSR